MTAERATASYPEDKPRTPNAPPRSGESRSLESVRAGAERAVILEVLHATHGRRADAARILGISRKTLWKKLKRLGVNAHGVTEE